MTDQKPMDILEAIDYCRKTGKEVGVCYAGGLIYHGDVFKYSKTYGFINRETLCSVVLNGENFKRKFLPIPENPWKTCTEEEAKKYLHTEEKEVQVFDEDKWRQVYLVGVTIYIGEVHLEDLPLVSKINHKWKARNLEKNKG